MDNLPETTTTYLRGKTILITGAAGFVGSHLVEQSLEAGATVIGVDSLITGSKKNLESVADHPAFMFIEADVTKDPSSYLPQDKSIDACLHFASPASPPKYQAHPVETYLVNSWGTHLLLSYLKEHHPVARFLFASTSEVYGDPLVHPQVESYWGNVNPNGARACYDESKRMGEAICGVFQRDFHQDVRIVRIFNTYGPRIDLDDGRVIPSFVKALLSNQPLEVFGDGSQTRSYCFVADLVRGILGLLAHPDGNGQTVNLGNPEELTILETAHRLHAVARELGITTEIEAKLAFKPLPKDDPTRRRPDISKAQSLLNWEPRMRVADGFKATLEWFSKQNATS